MKGGRCSYRWSGSGGGQGLMHHGALAKMKLDMLEPLIVRFGEFPREHRVVREVFGLT